MPRLLPVLLGLAYCVVSMASCTRPTNPVPGASPASPPGPVVAVVVDEGAEETSLEQSSPEPADGAWLVDEHGRRYFLERLPRTHAARVDATAARTVWGTRIEVVEEDAAYYYYKMYAPPAQMRTAGARDDAGDARQIAESYRAETTPSQRLRFVPFGDGLPTSGQWRDGFAIADMNGDGHPDIVHGPPRKGSRVPAIFLGDGRGGWRTWRGTRFPALPFDYGDVQVGDLDGDGHLDLVLSAHLRGFTALLGNGRGQFSDWSRGLDRVDASASARPPDFSSRAIRLVDWNGDGRLDLLALGEGPRRPAPHAGRIASAQGVALYLNQGNGSWRRPDRGNSAEGVFGMSLVLGDFDGDGRIDFATGSSVLGRKDIVSLAMGDGSWRTVPVDQVRSRAYVRAVAAGDFDGDGRADLALAYLSIEGRVWRTGIDILYARADGSWQRRALVAEEGRRAVTAVTSGDIDGDGRRDLVALTGDGHTWIFPGDGKGFFTREREGVPVFGAGCRGSHVELADLDGDGRDEVIASFAQEASSGLSQPACPSEGGLMAWKRSGAR